METRNVKLTLDKAKEWFKQGGDLKEIALQAYTEKELQDWPISIDGERLNIPKGLEIPLKIRYQWKLYKLLRLMNPKDFDPGYNDFYVPRIWWYIDKEDIPSCEDYVGIVKTDKQHLYVSIGGKPDGLSDGVFCGTSSGEFSSSIAYNVSINQLKCATPEIQQHLEKYFWKEILIAYYSDVLHISDLIGLI